MNPVNEYLCFICPFCGEENTVETDITAGSRQEFIQDCEVCCKPVEIKLTFDKEGNAEVEVRNDEGF